MTESMKNQIDALFALWRDGVCPGGQVAVRRGGEMVYDRCFGYADIENRLPVTPESVFHVASVSKQFTVFAVMLLCEDGLLRLDDDVRAYIPELIRFDEPVTVRNLMNNVSGIRDIWSLQYMRGVRIDDTITQKDAVTIISNQTGLNFEPGTQYMYSNSNFVLLSEIVERLCGKSLNDFLQARVFGPLGMTSTVIRDRYWQRIDNRARSFLDNGTEFFHSVLNYGSYGSTSLHTTTRDFMKWMEHFKNPTLCRPQAIAEMLKVPVLRDNAKTDYAGGLMIGEIEGHRYFQHGGADAAFRSIAMRLPDDDIDIVILANTQNLPIGEAADAIARLLLGLEPKKRTEPEAGGELDRAKAPGLYYSDLPNPAVIEIIEQDGELFQRDTFGPGPLRPAGGNLYKKGRLDMYIRFEDGGATVYSVGEPMKLKKANADRAPAETLLRYEGRYVSSEIETAYDVAECDGKLYIHHFRNGTARLYPIGRDRFVSGGGYDWFFQFTRGSGGAVIGLTMSGGRVQNLPFSKED